MELKTAMKNRLLELTTMLYNMFEEQETILSLYKYVDVDIIERTWDKHIKMLSGMSEETYEILYAYYLDGRVVINETIVIKDFDELIDYIVDKAYERVKD